MRRSALPSYALDGRRAANFAPSTAAAAAPAGRHTRWWLLFYVVLGFYALTVLGSFVVGWAPQPPAPQQQQQVLLQQQRTVVDAAPVKVGTTDSNEPEEGWPAQELNGGETEEREMQRELEQQQEQQQEPQQQEGAAEDENAAAEVTTPALSELATATPSPTTTTPATTSPSTPEVQILAEKNVEIPTRQNDVVLVAANEDETRQEQPTPEPSETKASSQEGDEVKNPNQAEAEMQAPQEEWEVADSSKDEAAETPGPLATPMNAVTRPPVRPVAVDAEDAELELAPLFLQRLHDAGGAAVAELLQRAARSEPGAPLETLAAAAYERSWEKLHCGSWKSVLPVWRQAFGLASVLQASCLLRSHQSAECLEMLDMCLMMAGPLAPPQTHALIARVEQQLQGDELESIESRHFKRPRLMEAEHVRDGVAAPELAFPVRRLEMPALEQFRRDVMLQNGPVVITGAMEFWPALGRAVGPDRAWKNLRYLRRVAGRRTVPVEIGSSYLGDDWGQELMTLNEFLDRHIIAPSDKDADGKPAASRKLGYLAQHRLFDQIPALGRDIVTPDYCTVKRVEGTEDDGEEEDITINSWFGPGGTVSPLHFDPKDNVLCQVVGAKYLRLYAPEESDKLYPIEGLLSNTSQVQVEDPDHEQFPEFRRAKYVECVLREGEMLYIPPKYWHYVRSLSTSFSVSFWWS